MASSADKGRASCSEPLSRRCLLGTQVPLCLCFLLHTFHDATSSQSGSGLCMLPLFSVLLTPSSEPECPICLCWEKPWVRSLLIEINPALCLFSLSPARLFCVGLLHHLHLSGIMFMSWINIFYLLHIQQLKEGQTLTARRQQNTTSCHGLEFIPSVNRKKLLSAWSLSIISP